MSKVWSAVGSADSGVGLFLLPASVVALVCSFVLTLESLALFADPSHKTSCDVNALLSCGTVMRTPEAALFGFPNPLLGLPAFAVLATVGVVVLLRVDLPRWFWLCVNVGLLFAFGLVLYFWVTTTFVIGALCIYCMVVWAMVSLMFWLVTASNVAVYCGRGFLWSWRWVFVTVTWVMVYGVVFFHFYDMIVAMF